MANRDSGPRRAAPTPSPRRPRVSLTEFSGVWAYTPKNGVKRGQRYPKSKRDRRNESVFDAPAGLQRYTPKRHVTHRHQHNRAKRGSERKLPRQTLAQRLGGQAIPHLPGGAGPSGLSRTCPHHPGRRRASLLRAQGQLRPGPVLNRQIQPKPGLPVYPVRQASLARLADHTGAFPDGSGSRRSQGRYGVSGTHATEGKQDRKRGDIPACR